MRADLQPDVSHWGSRKGAIAAWTKGKTLRISLGRKAMLADLAALELELRKTPGLSNVRDVAVAPASG